MVLSERYNLESNLDVSVFICPQLSPGIPIQYVWGVALEHTFWKCSYGNSKA